MMEESERGAGEERSESSMLWTAEEEEEEEECEEEDEEDMTPRRAARLWLSACGVRDTSTSSDPSKAVLRSRQ